jgi:hypothetical protein
MKSLQKIGGIAALYLAAAYLVELVRGDNHHA